MMQILHRILHRPPKDPEDSPALLRAVDAERRVTATDDRINRAITELERRDRIGEDGFIDSAMFPDFPRRRHGSQS